jgi:hypothetical protein
VSLEYGWNAFHTIAFPAGDGSLRALSTASKNKLYMAVRMHIYSAARKIGDFGRPAR